MRATIAVIAALTLSPVGAMAQGTVRHAPLAAVQANQPIEIRFDVRRLETVSRVEARWRARADAPWVTVVAQRVADGWRCVLPAQPTTARELEYHLVLVDTQGHERAVFASADRPHVVLIHPVDADRDELWDLARTRGRRLEFIGGGEYTDFGSAPDPNFVRCGPAGGVACVDRFITAWGMVRYRFHRTVRSVSVRVQRLEGRSTRNGRTSDVGLVAADTEVEFRVARFMSLTLRGTLGANEISVQGGAGIQLDFGVGSPTVVSLAFHGISSYGVTAAAWLRFETVRDTPMGAGVEVTNQPSGGDDWGTRLMLEIGRHFGRHFTLNLRGGYGARRQSAAGFSLGGSATLAF